MIQSRRHGEESEVLNAVVEKAGGVKKVASGDSSNHPAAKIDEVASASKQSSNHPASKFLTASIPAHKARVARRDGAFVKVAGRTDLYQEAATNDFWKISDDRQTVNRVVNEENGVIVE